jgi:RNA polymerase sigma-70 factor, ECF subfamily
MRPLRPGRVLVRRSEDYGVLGRVIIESLEPGTAYDDFLAADGPRLRRILVARYGVEVGTEVTSDVLLWAWENWNELGGVTNRVAYLYRVGQSKSRRYWRWRRRPTFPPEVSRAVPDPEPGLPRALARLPEAHRVAILLVHAHGWSYAEVAEALGVEISTVRNHVHRGMQKLRMILGAG